MHMLITLPTRCFTDVYRDSTCATQLDTLCIVAALRFMLPRRDRRNNHASDGKPRMVTPTTHRDAFCQISFQLVKFSRSLMEHQEIKGVDTSFALSYLPLAKFTSGWQSVFNNLRPAQTFQPPWIGKDSCHAPFFPSTQLGRLTCILTPVRHAGKSHHWPVAACYRGLPDSSNDYCPDDGLRFISSTSASHNCRLRKYIRDRSWPANFPKLFWRLVIVSPPAWWAMHMLRVYGRAVWLNSRSTVKCAAQDKAAQQGCNNVRHERMGRGY